MRGGTMTIDLYKTTDDNRVVNKQLAAVVSGVTVRPTEALSLMQPTFIVDTDNRYYAANYLYCDTFQRYYYINNITLDTGRRMKLHCSLDPLKTYAAALPDISATVIRSESIGRPTAIPDKMLPIDPNRYEYKSVLYPKGFVLDPNKRNFLLITR